MKNYNHFDVEDFVCDDEFIQWCIKPNEASIAFWTTWISNNPTQKSTIDIAKQIVHDLHTIEEEKQEENYEQDIWNKIENNINPSTKILKVRSVNWKALKVAAAIIFLIGSFFIYQNINKTPERNTSVARKWIVFENNFSISKTITLADNSTIVLEPFSTLKYPTVFSEKQREVLLTGEAFFDIARDTSKPFIVYANETITKVLGTSFTIKAFEGEKTVEVDVKSGKVAVYAQVASEKKNTEKKFLIETDEKILVPVPNKKLVVTPNQKVVFDHKEEEMIKTVTKLPKRLTQLDELPQFQFDEESIVKVFEALELVYGIDLEYDEEKLKNCTITTSLSDEPLFEKLKIIGMALELKIKEKDATIFITGNGCQ